MKVLDGAFLSRNTRLADGITLDALEKREGLLKQFNRNQNRSKQGARRRQPHPAARSAS
jgi:hypothetical protein